MTLKEFARDTIIGESCNGGPQPCYICVFSDGPRVYLEVELDEGTIGGVWEVALGNIWKARQDADELAKELTALGFSVFQNKEEWEQFLFGEGE